MGSIFSPPKPKPYEPSESQKALERQQLETTAEQKSEIARRASSARGRATGRRSLLTGSATGVQEKSATLG
jgi:hypothetical protein